MPKTDANLIDVMHNVKDLKLKGSKIEDTDLKVA